MNFNDFTIKRNMMFDDCSDLFRYQFWHWFLMTFGIDLGSILGPLWRQITCFLVIVLGMSFWIDLLLIFDQHLNPKHDVWGLTLHSFFASFFRTLVPFTNVRPISARYHFFQLFSNYQKNLSTRVPFTNVRPTSASWPFLPFQRKNLT